MSPKPDQTRKYRLEFATHAGGLAHLSIITNEAASLFVVSKGEHHETRRHGHLSHTTDRFCVYLFRMPKRLRRYYGAGIFALYHYQLLPAPRSDTVPKEHGPVLVNEIQKAELRVREIV
jgi:hypothetical protein